MTNLLWSSLFLLHAKTEVVKSSTRTALREGTFRLFLYALPGAHIVS